MTKTRSIRNTAVAMALWASLTGGEGRAAAPPPLTEARLKGLKTTANDPAGDSFVDRKEKLEELVAAFVADNSLASPMYLYFAASTASRLGRTEDAAFLFYAAQLRKAFDYKRYDISTQPDGNNAATYLTFLNQTIGQSVNPAIMAEPKLFTSVVRRLESWEPIPSPKAYYPEFKEAKGFKLPSAQWRSTAQAVKDDFLSRFAHRYVTLLNDPAYFEAFRFVQSVNFGKVDGNDPKNRARFQEMAQRMQEIEGRLGSGTAGQKVGAKPPAVATAGGRKIGKDEAISRLKELGYPRLDPGQMVGAAADGNDEVVDLFLAAGVPVDAPQASTGETAFFASASAGYLDLTRRLLAAGANATFKDQFGDSALIHLARYCDEVGLVRDVIKAGADVNARTRGGQTALKAAEAARCEAIVKLLKQAGAR